MKTSRIIKISVFINIFMVIIWILFSYIFGGKYDPWAFVDFIFPFIGIYFLVIIIFNLKFDKLKEKLLLSYLSVLLPLLLFSFILLASFEKASIILFLTFLIGPIIISYTTQFIKSNLIT